MEAVVVVGAGSAAAAFWATERAACSHLVTPHLYLKRQRPFARPIAPARIWQTRTVRRLAKTVAAVVPAVVAQVTRCLSWW